MKTKYRVIALDFSEGVSPILTIISLENHRAFKSTVESLYENNKLLKKFCAKDIQCITYMASQ